MCFPIFRAAHSRAGDNKPLYLDHPQFEGFEVRQTVGLAIANGFHQGLTCTSRSPIAILRHHYVASVQCLRRFATIHQYPDGVRMVGFAGYDACITLKLAAGPS